MAKIVRKILRLQDPDPPIVWEPTIVTVENSLEGAVEITTKFNVTINKTFIVNIYDIYFEVVNVRSSNVSYHEYITDIYIGNVDDLHLKAFSELNEKDGLYEYFLGDLNSLIKRGIFPRKFFKEGLKPGILKTRFVHYKIE